MNKDQARQAGQQIMQNDPPGTEVTMTNEGMASNPHGPDNHVDAWHATKQPNGQVSVSKQHMP